MPMLLEMVEGERVVVTLFRVGQKERFLSHINTFDDAEMTDA